MRVDAPLIDFAILMVKVPADKGRRIITIVESNEIETYIYTRNTYIVIFVVSKKTLQPVCSIIEIACAINQPDMALVEIVDSVQALRCRIAAYLQ